MPKMIAIKVYCRAPKKDELINYFESNGWHAKDNSSVFGATYQKGSRRVCVESWKSQPALSRLIEDIAKAEGRSEIDVWEDITDEFLY